MSDLNLKSTEMVVSSGQIEMDITKSIDKDNNNNNKTNDENIVKSTATVAQLFSTATYFDYMLMFVGVIGGLITGASIPFFNVLFGRMLDALNSDPGGFARKIEGLALTFVYVAIINLGSGFAQVTCWSITGERQAQRLREKYVRAMLSQEIGWFDTCGASELSTKLAELTGKVQDGMGRKVGDLIQYISQFIAAFIVGLYLCWQLTVVLLACIPLIGLAGWFMIEAVTAGQNKALEQYAGAGGLASESFSNIRTVTALNIQPDIINRYRVFLVEAMKVGIIKGRNIGLGNGGLFAAAFLTYALGFWYGGKLVADNLDAGCNPYAGDDCITGGTILAVFFSVIMGSIALGQLAPPLAAFASAKAAVLPIFDIINRKPLIDGFADIGEKPTEVTKGNIILQNVKFAYPSRPDIHICNGYDLSVNAGETLALVGKSGCGKSTIINLLLRFYDVQSGVVMIDGRDIKSLNVKWLRSQIGYVGQEPILFAGSILDNIAYGLNGVDDSEDLKSPEAIYERVIAASKLANAHDFISQFPNGYNTDVGSNGVAISGGQKQRIAIARALVKKPAILLLDEATSALDVASERLVQESIDKLQQIGGQTTIVIAHRLSTIRNADKIAVVSGGVIAEMGKHDDLLKIPKGLYSDLVRLQMSSADDDKDDDDKDDSNDKASKQIKDKNSNSNESSATEGVSTDVKKGDDDKTIVLSKEQQKQLNKRVWGLVYYHYIWFSIGIFGAAIFGAIFPCWGILLAKTQNMFYYTDTDRIRLEAAQLAGYYVLLATISLISATMQFYGVAQVGERISLRLRSDMFEALMRRDIAFYDLDENAIGSLTTRLADDSRMVHKAAGESLAKQLQAFFTLAIGLGIGLSASWKIALVVLSTFPVSIAASAVQMAAISGQQYDNNKDGGGSGMDHGAIISSAFTHMRTIAAFSMQFKVADEYCDITRKISQDRAKRSFTAGLGFGGAQMTMFLTYALLFWYGSTLISAGNVNFEDMMTAILSLMLGALGLGTALADLGDQREGLLAASRIFKAIDESKLSLIDGLQLTGSKPDTSSIKGKIELINLNFTYPTRPDAEVCKNYNLTIEAGEVVALVGPSGSGKSTIMNLLLRFYDANSGQILLDGVDIKDLNVRWLRSRIGYVGQEPVLFQGSVENNVAKGRADYSDLKLMGVDEAMAVTDAETAVTNKIHRENCLKSISTCGTRQQLPNDESAVDVEAGLESNSNNDFTPDIDILDACKASNAHDFISQFTNGYNTDVGEGSIMVSGGQKQRIAIARALVKKPAILLLDEATSALDVASEQMVQESIDKLQQAHGQTTIVIAHRLSTIKNADKIVVIDKGEIVEIGNHEQLLKKEGLYAMLWNKQRGLKGSKSSKSLLINE